MLVALWMSYGSVEIVLQMFDGKFNKKIIINAEILKKLLLKSRNQEDGFLIPPVKKQWFSFC